MASGGVVVPWEHWVCTRCLEDNKYAVWLIKLKCFKPSHRQHYYPGRKTLVSIDPSAMRLVKMRPHPVNIEMSSVPIQLCQSYPHCQYRDNCPRPHSQVEYETWEFIRTLFKDKHLKDMLCTARLVPQSPTDVCVKCYDKAARDYNTRWLPWLECAKPDEHRNEAGMTLIVGDDHEVVEVIELPPSLAGCHLSQLSLCRKTRQRSGCPDEANCKKAHLIEELEYWKWSLIHKLLEKVPNYKKLCERYSFISDENVLSAVHEGLELTLSPENYVNKFHKLVYLDEIAHCQKMATLCNGNVTVGIFSYYDKFERMDVSMIKMSGMDGAAMDYAIHGHAVAHIPLGQSEIQCVVSHRDESLDLLLHMPFGKPPLLPRRPVYVHFEINHKYFDGLHKAIDCLTQEAINKLFPSNQLLRECRTGKYLKHKEMVAIKPFTLDSEYQMNALSRMISSDPRVPFLVLGPFGTGKTRIIAAAVSALLCDPNSHILVCTYQNTCANTIYEILFPKNAKDIMRLVPTKQVARFIDVGRQGVVLMKDVKIHNLMNTKVIVTTFLTAANLQRLDNRRLLQFSHILIDEGAQARECESIGALSVVKNETKVVIVGDSKQSGPRVAVLSQLAQDKELGDSLLERLFNYYKSIQDKSTIETHTASLLTNYRCHPSILTFTSSLFYEHTLLSRSQSQTHPLAPYPLVFTCSSFDKNSKCLPAEDQKEAKVLVDKMISFVKNWPKCEKRQKVGLLASTRRQVNILKKELMNTRLGRLPCEILVKPTYLIQGDEFDAVFLSTIEPTDDNGYPYDPVRAMSNELVFNTIMTRARFLIYCVGNPFVLCELGSKYPVNCWKAYLQRCVQCETLEFAHPKLTSDSQSVLSAAEEIQNIVFPHKDIDEVTAVNLTSQADKIITQYIQKLKERQEYKTGCKLVRKPRGEMDWVGDDDSDATNDNVILCKLVYSFFDKATAIPEDPSQPPITIKGKDKLKGSLQGDIRRIDKQTRCVLFDDKTERAITESHFGSSFLCRVSEYNCIEFYPLDKINPKFVNLPTITRDEKMGVVCFDPRSINSTPRVCNVIPHEVALRMVFVVKFLGWKKECGYPLGIIIGALPSRSNHVQQLLLKMKHDIPQSPPTEEISSHAIEAVALNRQQHFTQAITIDPEGSKDHDDALTCTCREKDNKKIYSVGVHITDLNSLVRKGSKVDKEAQKRGCTVYNAPDSICSPMFPDNLLTTATISPGKKLNSFSVTTYFIITGEGTEAESISLGNVTITESSVTSNAELTYPEAQLLLFGNERSYSQSLIEKSRSYNSHRSALTLKQVICYLWKFAWFLRRKRLNDAALAYTVQEKDQLVNPEAHYLVEELMIWANTQVAKKLCRYFKNQTILRSQEPPDEKCVKEFAKNYKTTLPLSAACKVIIPSPIQSTVSPLTMLKTDYDLLRENLTTTRFRDVMHCVQTELHPQLIALQSVLRSLKKTSNYCILRPNDTDGGRHSDLQCSHYTHFTSPLRRYIDVIIQRQLHAALTSSSNCYTADELRGTCAETQKKLKDAKNYERDIKLSKLVNSLRENQKEYISVVSHVDPKQGKFSLCFTDIELRIGQKSSEITTQQLQKNHSKEVSRTLEPEMPYSWKVKLCSLTGIPASFLEPSQVEVASVSKDQLIFYSPDEHNCLMRKPVNLRIKRNVETTPFQTWRMLQDCTMNGEKGLEAKRDEILSKIAPANNVCTPIPHKTWRSPLCVYTLSTVLKSGEIMNVQLCATHLKKDMKQTPALQLLEVGPGVKICIHHNSDSTKCFVGNLTKHASKQDYDSLTDYVNSWEPLILSETAYASVKDSEFLLIRDVELKWPHLQLSTTSFGISYYKMPKPTDTDKCGVVVTLTPEFMQWSFPFFKFSIGDFVCIRFTSADCNIKYVFHMVVNHVDPSNSKGEVYMKFVLEDSNYISKEVYQAMQNKRSTYEIQLISSSLPHRRMYRSLTSISRGTELAQRIALGTTVVSGHHPSMKDCLSPNELLITNSYWPMKDKRNLNNYQKKAIKLAWENKFTMIQGPPGTGKSVTGAHIAYALAMRLSKEKNSASKCVMYCGPSQQSVNVVLDKFLELLRSTEQKQAVYIIRIFSKAVEKIDFRGPEMDSDAFLHLPTNTKCEDHHKEYSLHHIVRREEKKIAEMEERFHVLHRDKKIPSFDDIKRYRELLTSAEERVLKRGVSIILCTCNEAASHRITNNIEPKYCIIDECAMATEPECMVPIRKAEHVVLIGDHQQLQPVIQCKEAEKMDLGKSLFERYYEKGKQIHLLEVQYRMHRAICEFPSKEFYGNHLRTDESVSRRHSGLNLGRFWPRGEECPIVFCQMEGVDEIGYRGRTQVGPKSRYNSTEAEKIIDIAEKLVCQYRVPNTEIVILTPYKAQREVIKDKLTERIQRPRIKTNRRLNEGIKVKSITESQGSEYGIVLLSTVRSRQIAEECNEADIGWIRKNLGFVADSHRICVGITRSKYGLVIVGNEKVLKYDRTWKRLIKHYKEKGCFKEGDDFPR